MGFKRIGLKVVTPTTAAALVAAFLVATSSPSQAIDGGSAANGNPYGLRIWREAPAKPGWFAWVSCSAGLLKPRVIVTNAHCLKKSNTEGLNPSIYVIYPPGVNVTATPTTFSARQLFVRPNFNYESEFVAPDDIAFLVTDRDIGPQSLSGIASRDEIDEFIKNKTPLTWYGYGTSASSSTTNDPRTAVGVATSFQRGNDISFGPSGGQPSGRPCPGDSGSPIITQNAIGQQVLVGVHAGASPRCEGNPGVSWSASGPIAAAYADLIDQAYAAAGYPLLPSAPTNVNKQDGKSGSSINWQAPSHNAASVTGYRVMEGSKELCRVAAPTTTCALPSSTSNEIRVQALNAAGEGGLSQPARAANSQGGAAAGSEAKSGQADLRPGATNTVIDPTSCWHSDNRPILQIKIDGKWQTLARGKLLKSETCAADYKKFPYEARFKFALKKSLPVGRYEFRAIDPGADSAQGPFRLRVA